MSSPEKKGGNLIGILTMFALYGMCGFVTFLAAPAGDKLVRSGAHGFHGRFAVYAAVNHQIELGSPLANPAKLGEAVGDEFLAAVARVHRHYENLVHFVQVGGQALHRRFGVQHYGRFRPEGPYARQFRVQVAVGLDVYLYRLGAGFGEFLQIKVRTRHHEMHIAVEIRRGPLRKRDNVGTERDVRHEMGIHYVKMQGVRSGGLRSQYLVRKTTEVGGKQ